MGRYDFKVRRELIRGGQFRHKGDFNGFKRHYEQRRKRDARLKAIVIILVASLVIIATLFMGLASPKIVEHPEIKFSNIHKTL